MASEDKLKVKVRQSDDGRKKKVKIKNEGLEIKIRVKSPKRCQYCGKAHDHDDDYFSIT
ncbi:MAG: hypothetical protein GX354_10970 [Firmicutes bacterium]|nr:hypothetical protein [Bacillota bacterium]